MSDYTGFNHDAIKGNSRMDEEAMSDLEKLGGLEAAEKRCDNLSEVGFYTAEKLMRALIAKVKELEQDQSDSRKAIETLEDVCKCLGSDLGKVRGQLQSARELAERIGELDPEDTTVDGYVGIPVDKWDALFLAAREFLEALK